MSRAANCYDNAFMESCFGTIKTELEMTEYDHCRAARTEIASYIAYTPDGVHIHSAHFAMRSTLLMGFVT